MDQDRVRTFLDHHPVAEEYVSYYEKVQKLVTLETIQQLIQVSLESLTIQELHQSQGVINTIYYLKTAEQGDLILRIHNPHPFWRGYVRENHLACLNLVRSKTSVPLCDIITHGHYFDGDIGFEYIVMNKVENTITLKEFLQSKVGLGIEQKIPLVKSIQTQMLDYLQQIQAIEVPQVIGGLRLDGSLVGVVNDGPRIGPHDSLRSYLLEMLDWCEIELRASNISEDTFEKIDKVREYVKSECQPKLKYVLCHNDLFESNILVNNEGIVKAVIDWDSSNIFISKNDISDIRGYTNACELDYSLIQEWFEEETRKRNIEEINQRLKDLITIIDSLKWACFWVNNWWRGKSLEALKAGVIESRQRELANFDLQFSQYDWTESI